MTASHRGREEGSLPGAALGRVLGLFLCFSDVKKRKVLGSLGHPGGFTVVEADPRLEKDAVV